MSSRDKQRIGLESPEDNYEATVLDFLNKEIAAVQPARGQNDQSAELDALVSDLLKQVMTESDEYQPGQAELPEDRQSLISGMMPDTEEALPADSNLLVNLNRGLSQSLTESDIWDSQGTEPPPAATEQIGGDSLPQPEELEVPPLTPHNTGQDRHSAGLSPETAGNKPHPSIRERKSVFTPALLPKRKVPIAAVAAVVLLILAGGAAYYYSSFSSSASKNSALPPDNPAPVAAADLNNAAPVPVQTAQKPAKQQKTPPSKNSIEAGTTAPAAERSAAPVKEVQTPLPQQTANNAKANPPAPAFNGGSGEAGSAIGERAALDRPAAYPTAPPAAVSEPSPSIERSQSPVTAAGLLPSGSVDTPPALNLGPAPAKSEALKPIPQPLPALPSQARALVPAVPISQASPTFPEAAVRMRTSGTVILELQIDEKGRVVKATPMSGPNIFHYPAVNAALKWRYKPATINGANVPSQARVTMNFNLNK